MAIMAMRGQTLDAIQSHFALCEDVYAFMLEENRFLKNTSRSIPQKMLDRKRSLLSALDDSLQNMRQMSAADGPVKNVTVRKAAARAQQVILRAMLLDRENEQLLLKHALASRGGKVQVVDRPRAGEVEKRYKAHIKA
jgi:hypothetical protein